MATDNPKSKYIVYRYIDLFVLNTVSLIICLFLYPILNSGGETVLVHLSFLRWQPSFFLWIISGCFISVILIFLRGLPARNPFNFIFSYPPLWLSAYVSALFFVFFIPFIRVEETITKNTLLAQAYLIKDMSIFISISVVTVFLLNLLLYKNKFHAKDYKNIDKDKIDRSANDLSDPSELIDWLQIEVPISNENDDKFNLKPFAQRITCHITESPITTIGLVGPYGCGKSSVLEMVDQYLREPSKLPIQLNSKFNIQTSKQILTCKVGGWGLQKGSAIQHILNSSINELSKHVDCLSLIGLPHHYASAISDMGGTWGKSLKSLLTTHPSPIEILNRLDRVLLTINKRLIIYLEDLDRLNDLDVFQNEIAALLNRLKSLQNVSFILAIEQEQGSANILIKILDHIETIPQIPRKEFVKLLKVFRKYCLESFNDISAISLIKRAENFGIYDDSIDSEEPMLSSILSEERIFSPLEALSNLLISPRVVKRVFRKTYETWRTLHGEIDFDDILIINTLRESAPEAFAFLLENIDHIRGIKESSNSTNEKKERLEKIWGKCTEHSRWNKDAGQYLVDYLFECWGHTFRYTSDSYQRINQLHPTNYWVRLHAETVEVDEIKDQEVMFAINGVKENRQKKVFREFTFAEALFHIDGFSEKVEQFASLIRDEDICPLASEIFSLILNAEKEIDQSNDCEAFKMLWRLNLRRPLGNTNEWILNEISKALPQNLNFANELYEYWRITERHLVDMPFPTHELRAGFVKQAKIFFNNKPDQYIKAINPKLFWTTRQFVIDFSEAKNGGEGFNVEEWKWLMSTLLKAAAINSQIVIPQIMGMIVKHETSGPGVYKFIWLEDRVEQLFGKSKQKLFKLMNQEIETTHFEDYQKNAIHFTQQEVKKRLKKQK